MPHIQLDSSEYYMNIGDGVSVGAEVRGDQTPTVTWMFDGKDVSLDEDVHTKKDGNKHKMRIPRAAWKHIGPYTIKAVNEHGTCTKDFTLTLSG